MGCSPGYRDFDPLPMYQMTRPVRSWRLWRFMALLGAGLNMLQVLKAMLAIITKPLSAAETKEHFFGGDVTSGIPAEVVARSSVAPQCRGIDEASRTLAA